MTYVTASSNLPRSLDVAITVSRPQAEERTDLSILCVACENIAFLPNSNRVRFYSSIEAVEVDFVAGTEAHYAASSFFAQTTRAPQMAIGGVWLDPIAASLVSGALTAAEIALIAAVSDGSMDIVYDVGDSAGEQTESLTGLDFTGVTTVAGIVAILEAALSADFLCSVRTLAGGSTRIDISTIATGDGMTIAYPVTGSSGTFVGTLLGLTAAGDGTVLLGYTPTTIADELSSIQNAAAASSKYLYGWCLGASLRVDATQVLAAAWALSRTVMLCLVTNDEGCLDSSVTNDIGTTITATDNKRTVIQYHDNAQRYPDVAILGYMLHPNYRLQDAAVTAKFKRLDGIETVVVTETELATLTSKGINVYTAVGNTSRTYREGGTSYDGWYMDTVINLDNFVEDLSVNVFNVFLRNKVVPYNRRGQALLTDACKDTGYQYVYNGVFSDREVLDNTKKAGVRTIPAINVVPTPLANMSAADRAARIGPPISMTVYESGAIHSIAINVESVA